MADYCCEYTYSSITINDETVGADRLMIGDDGEIDGLDGAPIRAEIDDQGQSDGGIVHPKFFAARVITFNGEVHIQSVGPEDTLAYISAINTLESGVISALETQLNTATALSWTPTGGSAKTISCSYGTQGGEIKFSGQMLPGLRKFTFTLVAAEPAIS